MLDDELRKRLIDYFTSEELVELLDVDIADLVDLLTEHIEDTGKINLLEDFMNHGR